MTLASMGCQIGRSMDVCRVRADNRAIQVLFEKFSQHFGGWDYKMKLFISDVKRLVNDVLDGDVVDQTLYLICFSFTELSEQDQLIIAGMAVDIASKFKNISVLSALEVIFKLERFMGMSDGRYPFIKTYLQTARLSLPQIKQDAEMSIINDF
jgi:hypothetical protein